MSEDDDTPRPRSFTDAECPDHGAYDLRVTTECPTCKLLSQQQRMDGDGDE